MIEVAGLLLLLAWLRDRARPPEWRAEWGLAEFYARQDREAANPSLRFTR